MTVGQPGGLNGTVFSWSWLTAWRQQPGALLAALLAVALGVALALGIDLVNRSALHRFGMAINTVNGTADLQLTTPSERLPDHWLERIEQLPQVRAASPVIDTEVTVESNLAEEDGQGRSMRLPLRLPILGLDVFRAARVTPALMPRAADTLLPGDGSPLFADNSIFLSNAAMRELQKSPGDTLPVRSNGRAVQLTVAGTVPGVGDQQIIGIMDIGTAQWRLNWLDNVSRIDIRLHESSSAGNIHTALSNLDGGRTIAWRVQAPDQALQRMSNLSRAYRVNLNVLALVALFTGGFIVYATMSLTTLRLAPTLAMFHVLGAPGKLPMTIIGGLALVLGLAGSLLGVLLGIALAHLLLRLVGADLGGGYFDASASALVVPAGPLLLFFLLGVAACVAGALLPAWQIRALSPAQTLRNGSAVITRRNASLKWPLLLLAMGTILQALPPIGGLPLPSYLAIAAWLFAGVALTGPISQAVLRLATRRGQLTWSSPTAWLANQRLTSPQASTVSALAGVVASFALVCAMAIMVHSFRESVSHWLDAVLPADVYLRVPVSGSDAGLDKQAIEQLGKIPGVTSTRALRVQPLQIKEAEPALTLLARDLSTATPQQSLPVTGAVLSVSARNKECIAVYPSEPAARRLAISPGDLLTLPIETSRDPPPCFQAVAIWRDYARQHGAIAMHLQDYRLLTGDETISDLAINLDAGASSTRVMQEIRRSLDMGSDLNMRSASDIRALSLRIFDRSFAVTYALEAVALLVGLFGVATTYAGEALSRVREFGMLRHLGLSRRDITRTFGWEAGVSVLFGVLWGALLGIAISQILIHRVNPQSFHWTMQTHWPVVSLVIAAAVLVALGVITAVVATRRAAGREPIAAVRSDW